MERELLIAILAMQATMLLGLLASWYQLSSRMDRLDEKVDSRIDHLDGKIDRLGERLDARMNHLLEQVEELRYGVLEMRLRVEEVLKRTGRAQK